MQKGDEATEPAQEGCVAGLKRMELIGDRTGMDDGQEQHIGTTDARAGSTPHMTRYILGWGLALVVVVFLILLFVWR